MSYGQKLLQLPFIHEHSVFSAFTLERHTFDLSDHTIEK